MNCAERSKKTIVAVIAVLGVVGFAPAPSLAAFTRPFLRQITETPSGPLTPSGLALGAEESLWVSEPGGSPPWKLDQFESAAAGNAFLAALEIKSPETKVTPPRSLAINRSTGSFYVTGNENFDLVQHIVFRGGYVEVFDKTGAFVKQFGPFGGEVHVAVENSTEPSAGSVYVSHNDEDNSGDGLPPGIEKFNASGAEVKFKCEESKTCPTYIKGNEITGTPSEGFGFGTPSSIAVDSHGDIYAVQETFLNGFEVDEYSVAGLFLRSFGGEETPGLGENHENGGWGGHLEGLAVDPLNDHLLVSVTRAAANRAAVDEFDTASGHFLNQITEASQGQTLQSAKEVTVDTHGDLYLVEPQEHAVDVYEPGHFLPSFNLAEATERQPTTALLSGEVDPEGFPLADCHFEYVTEAAFKADKEIPGHDGFSDLSSGGSRECTPTAGEIPVDQDFHPVHAELTGLTSGASYRYRLAATTSGALGGTGHSAVLAFTAPHASRIDSTTADNLSSTFADLRARIDPLGAATSYRFEYLTAGEFQANGESWVGPDPATAAPVPDAAIGSGGATGSEDAAVLQHIGGLKPSTVYRFRVLASNECEAGRRCVTEGPDATFATAPQISPGLPDNRAYELLTPPNKGSAEDMFAEGVQNGEFRNERSAQGYPTESGDGFLLAARSAFGPFSGSPVNDYVFSRTPAGWHTTSLASPSLGGVQNVSPEVVFDPTGFSQVGIEAETGSIASAAGQQNNNLLGPPGGPYTTIHTSSPYHGDSRENEGTHTVGASRDLSRLVLESGSHTLCPGAEHQAENLDSGSRALCEYSAGALTPLDLNSEGELLNRCGAALGSGESTSGTKHNAVSADGSRVFFTAPDPGSLAGGALLTGPGCWNGATVNAPQLYLRSAGATVEVSAPEAGVTDPTGHHLARYVGASADGSKVFFVTETELTKEAEENHLHDIELYEYDTETGQLARVSAGESGHAAAGIWTVPAVSADGSAVYFTANGVLAQGASPGECSAPNTAQTCNLYRYDTVTGATTFVARVGAYDYPDATASGANTGIRTEFALTFSADWYTTPDGRYLLFATSRELTGYATAQAPGSECVTPRSQDFLTGHCDELYRYDSATGALLCVSCNPSGAPPTSNAIFTRSAPQSSPAAGVPAVRALSHDGAYAFFDSADALVPQDTNGTLDVYEWHDGRISLISSGHDSAPSFFLGSSADGANVFFGTHARLVPADTDTAGDVYDARICTETDPCVKPPAGEAAQCEGGSCQSPPPAPIDATPGSLTFSGAGNLVSEALTPPIVKPKTAAQLRAERLTKALKGCNKKSRNKRAACRRQARKQYAPARKKGKR